MADHIANGRSSFSAVPAPLGAARNLIWAKLWRQKIAPIAIGAGNTFILKPSERNPSASLMIADLFAQAGLPGGVFNVVRGDKTAVDALLAHPNVGAISFVESTPIAKYVTAPVLPTMGSGR